MRTVSLWIFLVARRQQSTHGMAQGAAQSVQKDHHYARPLKSPFYQKVKSTFLFLFNLT